MSGYPAPIRTPAGRALLALLANICLNSELIKPVNPTASAQLLDGPYGTDMQLQRGGNMVVLTMAGAVSANIPQGDISLNEIVPLGYRPAYKTPWNAMLTIDQSPSVSGQFSVTATGKIAGHVNRQIGQGSYIIWQAVYPTDDLIPANS